MIRVYCDVLCIEYRPQREYASFCAASMPARITRCWPMLPCRDSHLSLAMSELYADMWAGEDGGGRRVESASNTLKALVRGNNWFAGNGQHDAHEALRSILDLVHEELRRPVIFLCFVFLDVGEGGKPPEKNMAVWRFCCCIYTS